MEITNTKTSTSKEHLISSLFVKAIRKNAAIAVWRKPKASKIEIIIDEDLHANGESLKELDDLPPGFMAHPFQASAVHSPIYIKAGNYSSIDLKGNHQDDEQSEDFSEFENTATTVLATEIRNFISTAKSKSNTSTTSKEAFLTTVEKAIAAIKSGDLYKVVPAKTKCIDLPENFDLASVFLTLCEAYPNAFINCFYSENTGFYIGASPETLIRTKGDEFFTMALAGTQIAKGENPLKNAAWTQKEIEEQALVSRYIVDCFKKIRLREYKEIGPKTTVAGGLLHLKSEFWVDMSATNFPQLGSVMLDLLHPTSAICGMPKDQALEFLQSEESFDRAYFSGFIGPVNMDEETTLYVNLRCAMLANKKIWLYAGAGITEDSVPEKEWEETEMKCNIIGQFLQTKK
ncbi:chorismate-binding protein [Cyclobacterium marinum]|uniref:chorismate-binding protein n=1 Tax=Cyclobacterium marinum TaxID=104 RepID=UPI0011EBD7AA|nr:chorismate-binding protein [Cyclobacterium marinum]MBI0400221.1 chorismate-binding protein [Cyclobacterium marinum]